MWKKSEEWWKKYERAEEDVTQLFRRIQSEFPELKMDLDLNPGYIDLEMHLPQQPGLAFNVNLNLQGDSLHLVAGGFWCEWFSCTKETVVNRYYDAVTGLLSGQNRIIEYYQNNNLYKAKLQTPIGDGWKTIGTRFCDIAFPWGKTTKILQNVQPQASVDRE
jgi:hypothetical protein